MTAERCHFIKSDASLYFVGQNGNGTTGGWGGTGNTTDQFSPADVSTSQTWASVACGLNVTAAITTDGKLFTVGKNTVGALGQGATTTLTTLTQVGSATDWAEVFGGASADHFLAIKTDGTLWGWGANAAHELGLDTDTTDKTAPVQIGSDTDWAMAAPFGNSGSSNAGSLALKTTGALYWWGDDIGSADTTPTQIGSATDWEFITADAGVLAIKSGALYCYGTNYDARFTTGPGSSGSFISSFTQIGSATDWTHCSTSSADEGSNSYSLAVNSAGELWSVGNNGDGDTDFGGWLGDGTATNRTTLVQVGSATDWAQVWAGGWASYSVKSTGDLYAFGYHGAGAIGQGVTGIDSYLTPQLVTTSVSRMYPLYASSSTIPIADFYITEGGVAFTYATFLGDGDDIDDIVIPISSMSCSLKNDNTSHVTVVVPLTADYLAAINERFAADLDLKITHSRTVNGATVTLDIASVPIESVRTDTGGINASITVAASGTATLTERRNMSVTNAGIIYIYNQFGVNRYRLPFTPEIRAGDQITLNSETITVGNVSITINSNQSTMEITPLLADGTELDGGAVVTGTSDGGFVGWRVNTSPSS